MKKEEPLAPQEVATKRFEIICQLQDPALSEDRSLYCGKKQELAVCYGVSYRTISRWAEAYKAEGFSGLVKDLVSCIGEFVLLVRVDDFLAQPLV